ncbi:MAG: permease prefix domain 2-containing transporter [Rhodobacter sp.]|nr:permease prefix domain 2-containing transporter [Rhodobacter sp.]
MNATSQNKGKVQEIGELVKYREHLQHRMEMASLDGDEDVSAVEEHARINRGLFHGKETQPRQETESDTGSEEGDESQFERPSSEISAPSDLPLRGLRVPPKRAARLVRWFHSPQETEALLGDLEENFSYDFEIFGEGYARRVYWKECLNVAYIGSRNWLFRQMPFGSLLIALLQRFKQL